MGTPFDVVTWPVQHCGFAIRTNVAYSTSLKDIESKLDSVKVADAETNGGKAGVGIFTAVNANRLRGLKDWNEKEFKKIFTSRGWTLLLQGRNLRHVNNESQTCYVFFKQTREDKHFKLLPQENEEKPKSVLASDGAK